MQDQNHDHIFGHEFDHERDCDEIIVDIMLMLMTMMGRRSSVVSTPNVIGQQKIQKPIIESSTVTNVIALLTPDPSRVRNKETGFRSTYLTSSRNTLNLAAPQRSSKLEMTRMRTMRTKRKWTNSSQQKPSVNCTQKIYHVNLTMTLKCSVKKPSHPPPNQRNK